VSLALASAATLPAQAESLFLVPYHAAEKPIVDAQGRKLIIIDFADDAHEKFPKDPPPGWDSNASFHRPQVVNLVNAHAKTHGYEPQGMTTWVGSSTTAYLTDAQIKRMREDKSLKLLTEDGSTQVFSALNPAAPWGNVVVGSETQSWGRVSMNGKTRLSQSTRTVYIIDTGVAWHDDLPSVTARVNVACGGGTNCNNIDPGFYPVVGCWAHATHVAGIIGGAANGATTKGMYAGVDMVSITALTAKGSPWSPCAFPPATTSGMGYALDYVYGAVINSGSQTVPIINISMNSGQFGFDTNGQAETNRAKFLQLSQPAQVWRYLPGVGYYLASYPGAFIAQSAGNDWENVCSNPSKAYRTSATALSTSLDGIMVVGAIHHTGEPVKGPAGLSAQYDRTFSDTYPAGLAKDFASNYGPCVDVWAPGNAIVSAWGTHTAQNGAGLPADGWFSTISSQVTPYAGNPVSGSSGWLFLSGTSMAAPHVAAAAAYVADYYGLTTPVAIEAKLREFFQSTGYLDAAGQPINIIQLSP